MHTTNLREHVERAIAVEWPAFAREHPRLAEAIDRTLLVEQAMASLADDDEYVAAMERAAAAGLAAETLASLLQRLVREFLSRL